MRKRVSIRSLLVFAAMLVVTGACYAQIGIGVSVSFGPPELPVYEQPICPAEGYIWTPGYWAWDGDDYYWVPGTWVLAPEPGFFWTPGYWGWGGNAFFFHEGYWGPHVGFYGGINYGFGYFGSGYEGGRWDGGQFYYNRAVNNINVTEIHNVYNTTIVNENRGPHVSYNGGNGGINEHPTSVEESYARERHIPPVSAQNQHMQAARGNPELRASANHGKPPIAATSRPGDFHEGGVVSAREGGHYNPPPQPGNSGGYRGNPMHASELTSHPRPSAPNTGDPNLDRKYQQQQDKLYAKQEQEHQRLQQKQEQDHQRMVQQQANQVTQQQMEQRHQQQTQQMEQRHMQQQQQMQQRQSPPRQGSPRGRQ